MTNNAIITQEQMAIESVKRLANIVLSLRNDVFKEGLDFGRIPGTGEKPTLLQPGMEKLCRALHLRPEYVEKSKIEDFDKPLIYYRYECRLVDHETGICISTAIGSANSHESKWRWRNAERVCPTCGKPTIIKGKDEYGGGWICFAKKGGCGTKFIATDKAITEQVVGRVENPDIFDQMNTIDKIAQKRALGSAIKGAANVSELFTVDLEDFAPYDVRNIVEGEYTVMTPTTQPSPASVSPRGAVEAPLPLQPVASTNGTPTVQGASAKDDLFPPPMEGVKVIPIPTLGTLDMTALGKRAQTENLVGGRQHWHDLIVKMRDVEHLLNDGMTGDDVIEAIKQRAASKDLAAEGTPGR